MPDDPIDLGRGAGPGDPLPPPDAPDAPWFVYRSGPGWVEGKPYSRSGKIVFMLGMIMPLGVIGAVLLLLPDLRPVMLAGVVVAAVAGTLVPMFVLLFARGRKLP